MKSRLHASLSAFAVLVFLNAHPAHAAQTVAGVESQMQQLQANFAAQMQALQAQVQSLQQGQAAAQAQAARAEAKADGFSMPGVKIKSDPSSTPKPGDIDIHLNGSLTYFLGTDSTPANNFNGNKLSHIIDPGFITLSPGFTGATDNGVQYGAALNVWLGFSNPGVGTNDNTANTASYSGVSANIGSGSLVLRKAYGFVGKKEWGTVRFGMGDGAFTLFEVGIPSVYIGGWNSTATGGLAAALPSSTRPGFLFAGQGYLYATNKVMYITPEFHGFKVAASFEPNTNGFNQGDQSCVAASGLCGALSSSTSSTDIGSRRKNTYDVMAEYKTTISGVKLTAAGGYIHGSSITYTGTVPLTAAGGKFDALSLGQFGIDATYKGFEVGANMKTGQARDIYNLVPAGGRSAFDWLIGGGYTYGKTTLSGYWFDNKNAGAFGTAGVGRTLHENGLATSLVYKYTQHLSFALEYLYGAKHQSGFNFLAGAAGTANNSVQVKTAAVSATLNW